MRTKLNVFLLAVAAAGPTAQGLRADPFACDLSQYKTSPGLAAARSGDSLTITWDGDQDSELRLRLAIKSGTPVIEELSIRRKGDTWAILARDASPQFRVVSGLRRITNQQLDPLKGLGVQITRSLIERYKWDAFWDAPLNVPGGNSAHGNNTPPLRGILDQPGLPRSPDEIQRASAVYDVRNCEVKSNGARIEASFPGVRAGVFEGRLQYTVYRGTNLIRQEIIARTSEPSVAYKYDAGVSGLAIQGGAKIVWRDLDGQLRKHALEGLPRNEDVIVKAGNRALAAQLPGGAIAVFPPPHNFFWAREVSSNLGYDWYRSDDESSFSIGVRQPENEAGNADVRQNFALRSARPGTWQRMPVYLYAGLNSGLAAIDSSLAFTRQDHFSPLPGYLVMATHFHMSLVRRALNAGGPGATVPDLEVLKAAGVNIVAPVDGFSNANVHAMATYYEVARRHSGADFWVMPNEEMIFGQLPPKLGGHTDVLLSHPVLWSQGRTFAQPMVENYPVLGKVYHVGNAAEMMEMVRREGMLLFMPHPRSKGSTGFPDAIRLTNHFRDPNYRGIGFRWGMGLDGSETRLSEYRCLPTLDDMNNWVADLPGPPKYLQATSEIYRQGFGDDIYANNPVNYVKCGRLKPDDWSLAIDAMRRGDYFVTSGEVLIPSYAVEGTGPERTIVADVSWTFPLEFVEVVWGDGTDTNRQVIPATDLPVFGHHRFRVPFHAGGRKWVRFAAWDSAGNGAMVQPIKLTGGPANQN